MTRLRTFLAGVLTVLTVDTILHYHLVWVAMLLGGSICCSLIAGTLLDGRDRWEAAHPDTVAPERRAGLSNVKGER